MAIVLKNEWINIGRNNEPLFSYEYPIQIASTNSAGQCSIFKCTVANKPELSKIDSHARRVSERNNV